MTEIQALGSSYPLFRTEDGSEHFSGLRNGIQLYYGGSLNLCLYWASLDLGTLVKNTIVPDWGRCIRDILLHMVDQMSGLCHC